MDPKEVATSLVMPSSKPGPAGGPVLDWSGTGTCGPSSFLASSRAGPHNRWQGAWLVRLASPSSHMRASTASSTPSWLERRTTLGVTICPGPRPNGAGVAVREAVPPPSSPSAVPWRNALQRPRTVDVQAIGRQISCSFRTYGQAVLTLHERHSRLLLALRPPGKAAGPNANAISSILGPLPQPWRQTITFDNGTEFARHYDLHPLAIETFFCDTHSPWQKGGVENAIGCLRRSLPRKTDLASLPDDHFTALLQAYNNTPRKCLDYQTPAEIFWNHMLHFKCESTFRPSPE